MIGTIKRLLIINIPSLSSSIPIPVLLPTPHPAVHILEDEVFACNYLVKLAKNVWAFCLFSSLSLFISIGFVFCPSSFLSLSPSFPPMWHLHPCINLFFLLVAPVFSHGDWAFYLLPVLTRSLAPCLLIFSRYIPQSSPQHRFKKWLKLLDKSVLCKFGHKYIIAYLFPLCKRAWRPL